MPTEGMTCEVQAFTELMKRANDSERATLRLEVEKLRRPADFHFFDGKVEKEKSVNKNKNKNRKN